MESATADMKSERRTFIAVDPNAQRELTGKYGRRGTIIQRCDTDPGRDQEDDRFCAANEKTKFCETLLLAATYTVGMAMGEHDEMARASARLGTVLRGKYKLTRVLGVGGMAAVYTATHRNGMEVAVKILHRELTAHEEIRARFLREGLAANALKHPGVVLVIDDDVDEDGSTFLVMELLHGQTLEELWEQSALRLELDTVLALGFHLCDVLQAAHTNGIIHRDIKPANLFLTRNGQLKVLDFGIARLREGSIRLDETSSGTMLGTAGVHGPEQASGQTERVSAATDVFAVGATLFTLASGHQVHLGDTSNQLIIHAATTPPRARSPA